MCSSRQQRRAIHQPSASEKELRIVFLWIFPWCCLWLAVFDSRCVPEIQIELPLGAKKASHMIIGRYGIPTKRITGLFIASLNVHQVVNKNLCPTSWLLFLIFWIIEMHEGYNCVLLLTDCTANYFRFPFLFMFPLVAQDSYKSCQELFCDFLWALKMSFFLNANPFQQKCTLPQFERTDEFLNCLSGELPCRWTNRMKKGHKTNNTRTHPLRRNRRITNSMSAQPASPERTSLFLICSCLWNKWYSRLLPSDPRWKEWNGWFYSRLLSKEKTNTKTTITLWFAVQPTHMRNT